MEKTIFVLFGATGDLSKRKLLPALYNIYLEKKEKSNFEIFGCATKNFKDESFRNFAMESLTNFGNFKEVNTNFIDNIFYNSIDFSNEEGYKYLIDRINLKTENFESELIFYLAVPPNLFSTVIHNLDLVGINKHNPSKIKIIFEKPFGSNLKSARDLNNNLIKVFDEEQIYRIDHYLGKDAVQNFLVLRFANSLFEPIWNSHYIDNIQITAYEEIGVEQRAKYYDKSGALRDMVQNHLLQMLSLIAMEAPTDLCAEKIRDEKVKVLSSIKTLDENNPNQVVFGQYKEGKINGEIVKSYLQEEGIEENSKTETFVALKLEIDNWRWAGVPFYLRTGKRMNKKGTTIVVEFKKIPSILYNKNNTLVSNKLLIEVQPDASISLQFNIKSEKTKDKVIPVTAEFDHKKFSGLNTPEAYQILLSEVFKEDQSLFTRWDGVEVSWKIIDNLVECKNNCPMIYKYESGSNGPDAAKKLLERDNRQWY